MSRKISADAASALMEGGTFNRDNTMVADGCLYLHGSCIARLDNDGLHVTTAGWDTLTTRERLNALPGVDVHHSKKQLHLNGKPWDGSWTVINKGA